MFKFEELCELVRLVGSSEVAMVEIEHAGVPLLGFEPFDAEPSGARPHLSIESDGVVLFDNRLAVGQIAFAIGSPYGLEHSFSVGHISGFREFDRLYDGTILAEFIQTDAAINVGNSGGPVFNSRGEVIAIASRIISVSGGSQGLGFAVAINTAKKLLALGEKDKTVVAFVAGYPNVDYLRLVSRNPARVTWL